MILPLPSACSDLLLIKVMQTIKEVVDPEMGLNVVDLNMIKKVNIDD